MQDRLSAASSSSSSRLPVCKASQHERHRGESPQPAVPLPRAACRVVTLAAGRGSPQSPLRRRSGPADSTASFGSPGSPRRVSAAAATTRPTQAQPQPARRAEKKKPATPSGSNQRMSAFTHNGRWCVPCRSRLQHATRSVLHGCILPIGCFLAWLSRCALLAAYCPCNVVECSNVVSCTLHVVCCISDATRTNS